MAQPKTKLKSETTVTQAEYEAYQQAYDFFNRELFNSTLPALLIILNKDKRMKALGHFRPKTYQHRSSGEVYTNELALYPDGYGGRTDEEILSTLVHEMTHCQQFVKGKPGRRGYHNREWAEMMKAVGLYPSDTAAVGGKETGERVSHYIIPDGLYQRAYRKLAATGWKLGWQSGQCPQAEGGVTTKPKKTRNKYTCPDCDLKAWASPGSSLICGVCYAADGDIVEMEEEADES